MRFPLLAVLTACSALAQTYTISTFSGIDRLSDGLPASTVPFWAVDGLAFDTSGNLYVADVNDCRVRRISPSGAVTTIAGIGIPDVGENEQNVPARSVSLFYPTDITVDGLGNTYFFESNLSRIRKVSTQGLISTVAGNSNPDLTNDGIPAVNALVFGPMVADLAGNLYVYSFASGGNRIRRIGLDGIIRTVAGTNTVSDTTVLSGPALQVNLSNVSSLVIDHAGDIYFADTSFGLIRKMNPDGFITTVAGTLTHGSPPTASVAALSASIVPLTIALDGDFLYIISAPLGTPPQSYLYRVTLSTGIMDVIAGGPEGYSGDGGPAALARFTYPPALAARDGAVYLGDGNHVRLIKDGIISSFAGTYPPNDIPSVDAAILKPWDTSVDGAGNFFFNQTIGNTLERVGTDGIIHRVDGPWAKAVGVASDSVGNTYVSTDAGQIYRIPQSGDPVLIGGNGTIGYSGDNGPALQASFDYTDSLAADAAGNVYVGPSNSFIAIRKISAATGIVTTIAGNGTFNYLGDQTPAVQNGIVPCGLAVGPDQNLYVGDAQNNRVLRLTPDGKLATMGGDGQYAERGDGGPATLASLKGPCELAVDSDLNIYVSDLYASTVRRIDNKGIIGTIAGNGTPFPEAGDGGPALSASLDPKGLAVGPFGVIYVADYDNDRIRRLDPPGVPHSIDFAPSTPETGLSGQSFTFTVKVTDSSGAPVAAAPVSFAVTPSGSASFSPVTSATGPDGTATTTVTLGPNTGPITITATIAGFASAVQSITIQAGPAINSNGIVGAGLSNPFVEALSSNGLISIFGTELADAGTSRQVGGADLVGGKLPTVLAEVCVQVGEANAYMLYVSPTQLNVQMPALSVTGGNVDVRVIRNCGATGAVSSSGMAEKVQAATPEFFYLSHEPTGTNPVAAFNLTTGSLVSDSARAYPADILVLYGTGFGATNPPVAAGVLPDEVARVVNPVAVTIGGVELSNSDLLYAGVSSFAGLYQLNIRMPTGVQAGDQPIVVKVGGISSPQGASLSVGTR